MKGASGPNSQTAEDNGHMTLNLAAAPDRRYVHPLNLPVLCMALTWWSLIAVVVLLALWN